MSSLGGSPFGHGGGMVPDARRSDLGERQPHVDTRLGTDVPPRKHRPWRVVVAAVVAVVMAGVVWAGPVIAALTR